MSRGRFPQLAAGRFERFSPPQRFLRCAAGVVADVEEGPSCDEAHVDHDDKADGEGGEDEPCDGCEAAPAGVERPDERSAVDEGAVPVPWWESEGD